MPAPCVIFIWRRRKKSSSLGDVRRPPPTRTRPLATGADPVGRTRLARGATSGLEGDVVGWTPRAERETKCRTVGIGQTDARGNLKKPAPATRDPDRRGTTLTPVPAFPSRISTLTQVADARRGAMKTPRAAPRRTRDTSSINTKRCARARERTPRTPAAKIFSSRPPLSSVAHPRVRPFPFSRRRPAERELGAHIRPLGARHRRAQRRAGDAVGPHRAGNVRRPRARQSAGRAR